MKKQFLQVLSLAVITLALASCKGKDPEPTNYFLLGTDAKYVVKEGFTLAKLRPERQVEGEPTQEAMYYTHINLITEGFTLTADDKKGVIGTGKGSFVTLYVNTSTRTLEAGTYSLNNQGEAIPGSFWRGDVDIDISTDNPTAGQRHQLADGKLTVSKANDVFTIDFEGTAVSEIPTNITPTTPINVTTKSVKGHYVGKITSYVKQ